jgi:hypothetical protein
LELEWRKGNVSVREMQTLAARAHQAEWFALVNGRDLYTEADDVRAYGPERESSFVVFHTEEHIRKLFPRAEVRAPVNGAMQHCCVIRKR